MRLAIYLLTCALVGCGASASRAQARGAVLVTAEAVRLGDKACADVALEKNDLPLARACETAYEIARASVLTAAASVDAWDEGKKGDVACAIKRAGDELSKTVSELRARQASIPKLIEDAIALAASTGKCP